MEMQPTQPPASSSQAPATPLPYAKPTPNPNPTPRCRRRRRPPPKGWSTGRGEVPERCPPPLPARSRALGSAGDPPAPAPLAAFDVSHLPPRLPLAPVAELSTGSPSGQHRPLRLTAPPAVFFPATFDMNGGDEFVLFGSFTEAETKLFHGKPPKSADRTWELPEIQFGSLNFSVLNLQKAPSSITQGAVYPAKSTITKDNACSDQKETVRSLPNGGPVLFNGSITANANVSLNNVAIKNIEKTGATPAKDVNSSAPPAVPVPELEYEVIEYNQRSSSATEITENGGLAVDTPTISAPADEVVSNLNKKDFQSKPLLPHGLKNTGNICFLNASLQALLSCLPFVQLLQDLRNRNIPKVGYPTLSAFVEFISQFDVLDDSNLKKDEKFATIAAKSLNPAMFDTVLRNFTPDVPAGTSARSRQEDAQEFLSFAMDRMHDELVKLNGNGSNSKEGMIVSSGDDDDAWETVVRKNKSAIMRTQSFVPSELTAIFGGQLQSSVKATGNKASVTVQPFRLLHLDIFPDAVQTLDDALRLFSTPESLEGYRTSVGKAGLVTAKKLVQIHTLSKIMILHLKRFSYGNHGCTKLLKPLRFPLELVLSRDLLSSPSLENKKYELVATITHLGKNPSRGHYTADAKSVSGQWLRFDDDTVTPVSVNKVLHDQAYVLFYKQV